MGRARKGPDTEGQEWFRQEPPPAGLWIDGGLQTVETALRLVETLYALGARKVVVPPGLVVACEDVPGSNGLAACGFDVTLPDSGPEREALIWFIAGESGRPAWGPDVPLEVFRSRVGCRVAELAWT